MAFKFAGAAQMSIPGLLAELQMTGVPTRFIQMISFASLNAHTSTQSYVSNRLHFTSALTRVGSITSSESAPDEIITAPWQ